MPLVNSVEMSGYVATDPEVRGADRNVGSFRLRYDRSRKVKEEWKKEANWFSVVIFGGENIDRLLTIHKGDKVLIVGRLQQREYEGKQFIEIVANEFALVEQGTRSTLNNGGNTSPSGEDDWLN